MMKKNTKAFGAMEYIVLLTFIIGALAAMSPYITNALNGYFRKAGEGMDNRRQHDPYRTRDCIWDPRLVTVGGTGVWYSEKCYNHYNKLYGCENAVADQLDYAIYCRKWAVDLSLCDRAAVPADQVDVATNCPTTCCVTRAKHGLDERCIGPCQSMPVP